MTEEEKYALETGMEMLKELAPQIYQDGLHPAVKQIGGLCEDAMKTFRFIAFPLMLGRVGFHRFDNWCRRMSNEVDEKNMQEAQPNILLPTLAGLAINPDETLLGEMFFNILKSSIDKTKQKFLSPAFPKILEQLSKDEAVMLVLLKKQNYTLEIWESRTTKEYEEKLIDIKSKPFFGSDKPYKQTIKHNELETKKLDFQDQFIFYCDHLASLNIIECAETNRDASKLESDGILMRYAQLRLTRFGQNFTNVCITSKCKEYI